MSEEFDYVIVGAGSAGCVLAARLSEDPDIRVALLEAGGEDTQPEIRIPAIFPIMFKTELDWDLFGAPEPGIYGRIADRDAGDHLLMRSAPFIARCSH